MIQISITGSRDHLDDIERTLLAHGAQAVTLCDAGDAVLEPLAGETPLWPTVTVMGLFSTEVVVEPLRRALQVIVSGDLTLKSAVLEERDWTGAWLDDCRPLQFGRRLRIVPHGDWKCDPDAIEVCLEPGLAFGTGTHPTTALCLEWLDAHPPVGARVIDYGCGSGIIGIAALKLGARHVCAVDIDAQALSATRANAKRNGISHRQLRACRPAALSRTPADLLVANILANPLIELAGSFAERVKSGGRVVLSGLLESQVARVSAVYAGYFSLAAPRTADAWVLLEGTRL